MSGPGRILELATLSGEPVRAGDLTVTPQSQALILRLPFGGVVWNRPTAVLVERDGRTSRLAIVDVTRLIQVALALLSFALIAMARRLARERREERDGGSR